MPAAPGAPVLGPRALNRSTLARQWLLARSPTPVAAALTHLVALQAQVPVDPYVALWSRLEPFDPHDLSALLAERRALRAPLLRATLHLTTDQDFLDLFPAARAVLVRNLYTGSPFGRRLGEVDVEAVLVAARTLLDEAPRSQAALRPLLAERWPDADVDALVYAVTHLEPVVQVPPRGLWATSGGVAWARAETWLGRPVAAEADLGRLVERYLAAYGPAGVRDAQTWSGLTRLGEVFERLRPRLMVFQDETGRELFDLPDAPRPDPDTPAPVRFLPQYDNLLLAHADRSRFLSDATRAAAWPAVWVGSCLVDGLVAGTWRVDGTPAAKQASLEVAPFAPLPDESLEALEAEGRRLLTFLRPRATSSEVRLVAPGSTQPA
jgi:hypothetical protein